MDINYELEIEWNCCSTGDHRIAWWYCADPGTVFYEPALVGCIAGNTASYILSFTFEECDGVCIEGYVQPVCVPEGDPGYRLDFGPTDVPPLVGSCPRWVIECESAGVANVDTSASPGNGYAIGDSVVFVGGGGVGAAADVSNVDAAGAITSIVVLNPGGSYTSIPTATINSPGGGGGALPIVHLETCIPWDYPQCDGLATPGQITFDIGDTTIVCNLDPAVHPGMTATLIEDGSTCECIGCVTLIVENHDDTKECTVWYQECETLEAKMEIIPQAPDPATPTVVTIGGDACKVIVDAYFIDGEDFVELATPC